MRVWMFLRDLPWTAVAWALGLKAREASDTYEAAGGALETGFEDSSKAQIHAIAAATPELSALKRVAIRRWAVTIAIQMTIFAAVITLAIMQD